MSGEIDDFLREPHLRALLSLEGSAPHGSAGEQLAILDAHSSLHWDLRSRAGTTSAAERTVLSDSSISEDRKRHVLAAARALGMATGQQPKHASYDHLLILGGLARSCLLRSDLAAQLVRESIEVAQVCGLTTHRKLLATADEYSDELAVARSLGRLSSPDEAGILREAIRRAFRLSSGTTEVEDQIAPHGSRRLGPLNDIPGTDVSISVAPPERDGSRATTVSTLRHWAATAELHPGTRLLIVTSAIYGRFQRAAAVQHVGLTYGVDIDVATVDPSAVLQGENRVPLHASHYLQELRSTIRAYRSLLAAVGQPV